MRVKTSLAPSGFYLGTHGITLLLLTALLLGVILLE